MRPEEKDKRERGIEGEGEDAICQRGFVKDGAFEVITRHSLTRLPSTAHPPLSLPKPPYFFPSSLLSLLVWETERRVGTEEEVGLLHSYFSPLFPFRIHLS